MSGAPKWRSPQVEDYLKGVYSLAERTDSPVTTTALAARLGVSTSSCSGMIRKLADLDLVAHARYGAIELTADGLRVALEMVRRHRLVELYLVRALGYSWDEVHDEAEVLEHAVSPRLLDRIAERLGDPVLDPHGDPIPTRDGRVDVRASQPLSSVGTGASGEIVRVADTDPDLLRYLADQHVGLGDRITVVEREPFGGPTVVRIGRPPDEQVRRFGSAVADAVSVAVEPTQAGT
ncbi:MAG: metal-dependent transcriptional regulator [Pseudonocardiaceae bacterium]